MAWSQVGPTVRAIPVTVGVSESLSKSVEDFAKTIHRTQLRSIAHEHFPLSDMRAFIDSSSEDLFEVLLNFEKVQEAQHLGGSLSCTQTSSIDSVIPGLFPLDAVFISLLSLLKRLHLCVIGGIPVDGESVTCGLWCTGAHNDI